MGFQWTFEDYRRFKQHFEKSARTEMESKLRAEMRLHGRQQLLVLFQELVHYLTFEEDMLVLNGGKPRTYADACRELSQCLGNMKIEERKHDARIY